MMHTLLCRRVVSILYKYTTYYTSSILIIHNPSEYTSYELVVYT